MPDGRFSADIVLTLSKRAALLCSNPDCGALTSGPTAKESGSTNIGEAAHIFGRTSTSARHKPDLAVSELSDITHGIWLCRNCHKAIDSDALRYPAALLFEWKRVHEKGVLERLGRPSDQLREKVLAAHLRLFKDASPLAQQIVIDRPPYWEYKLTTELLRTGLEDVKERWRQLKLGMYFRKSVTIGVEQITSWISAALNDISKIINSLMALIKEMQIAWGPPGVPGDDQKILSCAKLIVAAAENVLAWEEELRFAIVPEEFQDLVAALQGIGARQIDEVLRIPAELTKIFSTDHPKGTVHIELVFSLPENFEQRMDSALQRASEGLLRRLQE
jgi:hypothetical protein